MPFNGWHTEISPFLGCTFGIFNWFNPWLSLRPSLTVSFFSFLISVACDSPHWPGFFKPFRALCGAWLSALCWAKWGDSDSSFEVTISSKSQRRNPWLGIHHGLNLYVNDCKCTFTWCTSISLKKYTYISECICIRIAMHILCKIQSLLFSVDKTWHMAYGHRSSLGSPN